MLYAKCTRPRARIVDRQGHGVRKSPSRIVCRRERTNHAFGRWYSAGGTDLGEYILQINDNEARAHHCAGIHKDKEEISDLFARSHAMPRKTEIAQLTREARDVLREHFLSADMGVTGANFLIAANRLGSRRDERRQRRLCTIMPPRVHVVLTGIEKILPTLEDLRR